MNEIPRRDFVDCVSDADVFRKLKQNTDFPYTNDEVPHKQGLREWAEELYLEIQSGNYMPSVPRYYQLLTKANGAPRIVPVLTFKDLIVYRTCATMLATNLTVSRVPGTYGGWELGGPARRAENEETKEKLAAFSAANPIDPFEIIEYQGVRSLFPEHWANQWSDFQKHAYMLVSEFPSHKYITVDVANFYDSIRLDVLESNLRIDSPDYLRSVIDLLMVFLRYWNRQAEGYSPKTIGIPQDESGDASRMLANYYLRSYDRTLHHHCVHHGGAYLRFADDQVFSLKTQTDADNTLFSAGLLLNDLGLNLNAQKTRKFDTGQEFEQHWGFNELMSISMPGPSVLIDGVDFLKNLNANSIIDRIESDTAWKWQPTISKLLGEDLKYLDAATRSRLMELLIEYPLELRIGHGQVKSICENCNQQDLDQLVGVLIRLCRESIGNGTILYLKRVFSHVMDPISLTELDTLLATRTPHSARSWIRKGMMSHDSVPF